jgi:hypothetical protein
MVKIQKQNDRFLLDVCHKRKNAEKEDKEL